MNYVDIVDIYYMYAKRNNNQQQLQLFKASKISDIRHFDFRLCLCSFDDSLSLSLHQNPRVSGRI